MAGIRKSADLGTKGVRNIANDAVFPSTVAVTSALAGTGISVSSATGAVTVGNTGVTGLTGTANQITVSASTGSVTLSLPQNVHTGATPTFAGMTLNGAITSVNGGVDGGWALRTWTANSSYVSIATRDMAGAEYCLLSDGTQTYISAGVGGTTYIRAGNNDYSGQVAVRSSNVDISGQLNAANVYITGAYNGPLSNSGAIIRLRSGNEGSFIWDGSFGFLVDGSRIKNFTIQHPTKPNNYLVHACAEGPTSDVFYRGEGRLFNGRCVIDLPDYFEELTELEGRSIMLTPIADENGMVANLAAYEIYDGHFLVEQIGGYNVPDQRFWWRVDAVRKGTSFPVEPLKESVEVGGFGPYTFIKEVA